MNLEALPVTLGMWAFGVGVFVFRFRLTRASDRWYGRTAGEEDVRRRSRGGYVGLVLGLVLGVVALFV